MLVLHLLQAYAHHITYVSTYTCLENVWRSYGFERPVGHNKLNVKDEG